MHAQGSAHSMPLDVVYVHVQNVPEVVIPLTTLGGFHSGQSNETHGVQTLKSEPFSCNGSYCLHPRLNPMTHFLYMSSFSFFPFCVLFFFLLL